MNDIGSSLGRVSFPVEISLSCRSPCLIRLPRSLGRRGHPGGVEMAFKAGDILVPANGREVELVLVVVGHGPERASRRRRANAATVLAIWIVSAPRCTRAACSSLSLASRIMT